MRNPMELTGRTVIVTGTGQGIGKAISELVLDLGGNLVMVERNPETFAAVSAALAGDRTLAIQGDVTDDDVIEGSDVTIEQKDGYTVLGWAVSDERKVVRVHKNLYVYLLSETPQVPYSEEALLTVC